MTESEHLPEEQDRSNRNKLISRVVLVTALIVALLGGLLIFEHKTASKNAEDSAVSVLTGDSPRIGISVSASNSAPTLSEDVKQAIQDAPDSAQLALASMSNSSVDAPVAVVPEGTSDVPNKLLSSISSSSVTKQQPRTGRDADVPRERVEPTKQSPLNTSAMPTVLAAQPQGLNSREQGSFVLQLGVFSNPVNAEELRSKLKMAGIPTQLETRVQVGPFSSKEEAVKIQEKLRQLGVGNGLLIAANKKP